MKIRCRNHSDVSLTPEFNADEVLDTQIFQEDPRGGWSFKQEGDVSAQLPVEGGKVKIRRLLFKKRCVPEVFCDTNEVCFKIS